MVSILLLFVIFTSQTTDCYKILAVFPVPGKSHGILGDGFVRNLLADGHEVTYLTSFPVESPPPNLHQIDVSDNFKAFPLDTLNITAILNKQVDAASFSLMMKIIMDLTRSTVMNQNVQNLITDPKVEFDLVIAEWMFSEVYAGFSVVFNCPYIWVSTLEPHWMVLDIIDEMPNPAYNVNMLSKVVPPLSFWQRCQELYMQVIGYSFKWLFIIPVETKLYEEGFGPAVSLRGRSLPPFHEIKYNASIMFGNSHVSTGSATRLPQNYKPIGGYHIDTNLQPLTKDLQEVMDKSKDGVIYFSMGSNLKSKLMPEVIKKQLLLLFKSLKQTILWKFEEVLDDTPENVQFLKWASQPSILAHPNCKLFITHGGLLSTTEAIHFGVPIIGIPMFADQFTNVDRAVHKGFAKKVDFTYNVAEELKEAIKEMTTTSKYADRVKELSEIYHDRPMTPGAELIHWVRHVVRTRGAPHLRSPALLVPWYQKMYLDFAGVLVSSVILLIYTLKFIKTLYTPKKVKRS